jgi:hypothetical protein
MNRVEGGCPSTLIARFSAWKLKSPNLVESQNWQRHRVGFDGLSITDFEPCKSTPETRE